MMDIVDIREQPLSTILADFAICTSCRVVDRDPNRAKVGYQCPRCGVPSTGARIFFSLSVTSLIDLMQEFFHLDTSALPTLETTEQTKRNHQLAVVILFCTLGEVLLQDFLIACMRKERLPGKVQERLLNDNLFIKPRVQRLFPALTGVSWRRAIEGLSDRRELDYLDTTKFFQAAIAKRNLFLHTGNKWAVPADMPEDCMRHIWPLLCLFVGLHNEYLVDTSSNMRTG